jgi:hypothetical protein
MTIKKHLTALSWFSFSSGAMGHGRVAFGLTDAQRAEGQYDPKTMFVHKKELDDTGDLRVRWKNGEFITPELEDEIERDCAELARLLNKFLIVKQYFADPDPDNRK